MTVSTTTNKVSYTGNGTLTTFAYTFKIFAAADLKVYVDGTLKTLTTHYTVTNAGVASGGNVVFTSGNIPANTKKVVIERILARTQSTDLANYDKFDAEVMETALDRLTFIEQEIDEAVGRSVKFATTVTDVGTVEVSDNAATRANKIFGFDSAGNMVATQEIGIFRSNWATSTAFSARDIVKDTSNGNIYLCNTAHTSSGAQPISTNTDVAKWDLIVDAATATTSSTAAASSATAAATSATASATSASLSEDWSTKTSSAVSGSDFSSKEYAQGTQASTGGSAKSWSQDADAVNGAGANDRSAKAWSQGASMTGATLGGSAKDWAQTAEDSAVDGSGYSALHHAAKSAASATAAATHVASAAAHVSTASGHATAAAASATAAAASLDSFDDIYLGAKSSDPTVDNDGDALTAGDQYFSTTTNRMRVYSGSAWADVALDAATVVAKTSATGSGALPSGTTAQRDGSPSAGYLRFNSTTSSFEGHNGSAWAPVGGGATGGSGEQVFVENENQIDTSYTISTNFNALTTGPITVASGVTVTVPSGSAWIIL